MKIIRARNVNDALPLGLRYLAEDGVVSPSRNGAVHVAPVPVTTIYRHPEQRVLFNKDRDANPFFHFFESLWMLAGRDDLGYVANFARNMVNYSDDGVVIRGAYGYRWRKWFGNDQLTWAVERLKKDPTDRRVVIGMWDPSGDPLAADEGVKDVPCNLTLHLQVNQATKELDMSVFCRSNDVVWGAYGANAVHFSFLLEYVARAISVPVGKYYQISNNYHAYEDLYDKLAPVALATDPVFNPCLYTDGVAQTFPLMPNGTSAAFDSELLMFLDEPFAIGFRQPFFNKIARPLLRAHQAYKSDLPDRFEEARDELMFMPAGNDWRIGAEDWIDRREASFNRAKDDGPPHE